jgi:hypothetical protein
MEFLAIELEGKREDLQWIQVLVPIRHLSLNRNFCGLRRCLRVGYSDEEFPLQDNIFLDTWDINCTKDCKKTLKPIEASRNCQERTRDSDLDALFGWSKGWPSVGFGDLSAVPA